MRDLSIEKDGSCESHAGMLRHVLCLGAVLMAIFVCGVYWYTASHRKLVLVVAGLFGIIPAGVLLLHMAGLLQNARNRLVAFASALSVSCLLFAVLFPPFSVPDEYHHYLSSYWLSESIVGEVAWSHPETIEMRQDDWELYSNHGTRDESLDYQTFTINAAAYQQVFDEFSLGRQYEGERSVPDYAMFGFTLGGENAIAKVGSVAGILLAKVLDLGAYPLFYLGRFCSAAFFVACAVAAVKITPVGKNALMAISLFPMTLQLAASYSYDGGTIGLSFVFIALALRAIFSDGVVDRRMLAALTIFAALLAPCKAIYVLEVGLVLFIPTARFASKSHAITYKALVLCLAALVVVAAKMTTVVSVSAGTSTFAFPGERTYSLGDLVSDPLGTLALFFRTLDVAGDSYMQGIVGSNLGWLQQNLGTPVTLIGVYVVGALFAVQRSDDDGLVLGTRWRALFALVGIVVLFAAMLSMTVAWTPMTMDTIQGVQGRYLIPALPLVLLALRFRRITVAGDSFATALALFCLLNTLYMTRFIALSLMA